MNSSSETIIVGKVLKPRGQKGELTVHPLTYDPKRFSEIKSIFIKKKDGSTLSAAIEKIRFHKDIVIIKFKGIDTQKEAWELENAILSVLESDSGPLPEGHYYMDDIIGCEVFEENGNKLGVVEDIYKTGSNDVFLVKSGQKELLIPAVESFIMEIDTTKKKIVVKKPEYI